jgi:ATP-binding cassette subfamily B protein
VAEAKFSGDAFRLFRWRSPETRMQMYLETVIAREDHAKEVKLFGLGPLLLERYRAIFRKVFREDRALTVRRDTWGFFLGLISTAAFYAAYAWIAVSTVRGQITLGQMTMYVLLFRQGQSAVTASLAAIGGMYEDNLYLSTLYDYLETPVDHVTGTAASGPDPADGVRFQDVSFTYPGAAEAAVDSVSFHLRPGESLALVGENGSGKTTIIKLLTRLYTPTSGRILLDGLELSQWDPNALRRRIAVIFQDFARYQLKVGENIGVGDVAHFADEERWRASAELSTADEFIEDLPEGYQTQLGKWFRDGRELSGGQWQKIALARAFIREGADILVLDEPTAAMDARAEAEIFEQFRELARERMVMLISHRFSTVRMADQILVIQGGRILERGSHEALMRLDGHYAHLFSLQARGYR